MWLKRVKSRVISLDVTDRYIRPSIIYNQEGTSLIQRICSPDIVLLKLNISALALYY